MVSSGTPHSSTSRRRLFQLGAVALGGVLIGAQGAMVAHAAPSDAGGDGAPPPPGNTPHSVTPAALGSTSYNGWTVGTPGSVIGIQNLTVPGTSVTLGIRSGDVATVLLYVAQRFNAEVEPLQAWQCGGYDYRPNVNNPSVWSNHASGTAIDLNSANHPNGSPNTFNAAQTAAVRAILAACGPVVYWGQDYRGVVDGMHFEINVPPGSPALSALANRIRGGGPVIPPDAPGLGSYRDNAGARHVFGVSADGQLQELSNATGSWRTLDAANRGYLIGTPAVTYRNGRCDVFGIGLDGGGWTMHRNDGGGWSTWTSMGGSGLVAGFDAIVGGNGDLHVFCVTGSGVLWQFQGSAEAGWNLQDISNTGTLVGSPAGSYRNGRYDVFGIGLDGAIWQQTYVDGDPAWRPWRRVGGSGLVSGVSVIRDDAGAFKVVGVDTALQLQQFSSPTGSTWTAKNIANGGTGTGTPSVLYAAGRLDTFLVGGDGQGWVQSSVNNGAWGGWAPTGGSFR